MLYIPTIIITAIFFLAITIETLRVTYYLQIKEYRFDRLLSYLKEHSLFEILTPKSLLLPSKSFRNIVIVLGSISFLILATLYALTFNFLCALIFNIFLLPFSVIFPVIMMILTQPIADRKRHLEISKAVKRLQEIKPIVIGITGSFGKTSVKEYLHEILSQKFRTEKTSQNQNTPVGVAMSVNQNLKQNTEVFVAEIGAYKRGEIREVTDYIHPQYAIVTGLGNQHVDLFGSRDNLVLAKRELPESLSETGVAYINFDSDGYEKLNEGLKCKIVTFSLFNNTADIFADEISISTEGVKFTAKYKKQDFHIKTKLLGKHNILNLLPCIALASDLGVDHKAIEKAVAEIQPVKGRLKVIKGIRDSVLIDDSYNSNLNGFLEALDILQATEREKKYVVTQGILELGSERKASYERLVEKLQRHDMRLLTTDKFLVDVAKGCDRSFSARLFKNQMDIFAYLREMVGSDTAVLIEGRFLEKGIRSLRA